MRKLADTPDSVSLRTSLRTLRRDGDRQMKTGRSSTVLDMGIYDPKQKFSCKKSSSERLL